MRLFSYDEIDELGEGLIREYLGIEANTSFCVDIEGFVTDFLGLPLIYRTIAEKDSDKIGFIADGITPLRVHENGSLVSRVFDKGTIVIEKCLRQEKESGRRRFTISHGRGKETQVRGGVQTGRRIVRCSKVQCSQRSSG